MQCSACFMDNGHKGLETREQQMPESQRLRSQESRPAEGGLVEVGFFDEASSSLGLRPRRPRKLLIRDKRTLCV